MRLWLRLIIVTAALIGTFGAGFWAHAQTQPSPRILSGSDIGFRVDQSSSQLKGKVSGTWVVRVGGEWVEPEPPLGIKRVTER